MRRLLGMTGLLFVSSVVLAHPSGHQADWVATLLHVLSEPDHLLLLLLLAFAGVFLYRRYRARKAD